MARTCLVTGGAGFIGCAISSLVKNQFDRVVALDNMHPQVHPTSQRPAGLDPAVELVVGDVTEAATWDTLLAGFMPDVIIHLAAETGTGQSLTEGTRHANVNVVGSSPITRSRGPEERPPGLWRLCPAVGPICNRPLVLGASGGLMPPESGTSASGTSA